MQFKLLTVNKILLYPVVKSHLFEGKTEVLTIFLGHNWVERRYLESELSPQ